MMGQHGLPLCSMLSWRCRYRAASLLFILSVLVVSLPLSNRGLPQALLCPAHSRSTRIALLRCSRVCAKYWDPV